MTYADDLKRLRNVKFLGSKKYRDQQLRADSDGVHPVIIQFDVKFRRVMGQYGVPFFAHCMMRDREEQERVFREGHSKARFGQSAHNFGLAVDLIHSTRGWKLTDREWAIVGVVGKEVSKNLDIPLKWGGDFEKLFDPAHWELQNWHAHV